MELFELVLILLASVIASAVLDQFVSRASLPLIQIAVGVAVALAVPSAREISIESELFLVLFIAPLLFNEARESNRRALSAHKWPIMSLAIALVLVTVLIVGFTLNLLVPSIPLAAAFALAAALGPTDAAAVAALGSTVKLSGRQETLLSGESLINDASGVVSFQFAVAAAVTGAFSAVDAAESFALLFFGGIAAGLAIGLSARIAMTLLLRRGYVSTTVHVLYEVFSPFAIFIAAESMHVSGILAVVAAGLVMVHAAPRLSSSDDARRQLVSKSFWEVIVFLINGVLFVMLGMQLPLAVAPTIQNDISLAFLLGLVVLITFLILLIRFVWVCAMELVHRDALTGKRGWDDPRRALSDALVTTVAGPKGAVTLSIILTLPAAVASGDPFPQRDLLVFLASATILLTLLVADNVLPLVAPKNEGGEVDAEELRAARIKVLRATVRELEDHMREHSHPEYEPATRLAVARYRARLNRERYTAGASRERAMALQLGVLAAQRRRADELQRDAESIPLAVRASFFYVVRAVRSSLGYMRAGAKVGASFRSWRGKLLFAAHHLDLRPIADERSERVYYDAILFCIELERAAIAYLGDVVSSHCGEERSQVRVFERDGSLAQVSEASIAEMMLEEHEWYLRSLSERVSFGQESVREGACAFEPGVHDSMPADMLPSMRAQFRLAREYADEVDAAALSIELDFIRRLVHDKQIGEDVAKKMREDVYVLQFSLHE